MPRHLLAALSVFTLALASTACKPAASGGTGGPPCQGANPDQSCYDCEMSTCPTEFAALESACGDFLACEAECTCSDVSCLQACAGKIDSACASADSAARACQGSKCDAACTKDAGAPTGSCATLAACCPTLPAALTSTCTTAVQVNSESVCAQELGTFQASLQCSGSGGMSCAALTPCCASLTDASQKQGCDAIVQSGVDASCGAGLQGFKAAGLCP
jgi:hypothetical protein